MRLGPAPTSPSNGGAAGRTTTQSSARSRSTGTRSPTTPTPTNNSSSTPPNPTRPHTRPSASRPRQLCEMCVGCCGFAAHEAIVEVAAGANAELDQAVLRPRGRSPSTPTTAVSRSTSTCSGIWASTPATSSSSLHGRLGPNHRGCRRHQPGNRTRRLPGRRAGRLPLHRFNLEDAPAAHAAVESGAVGKVLITVASG
jgi:hypothetical protein